MSEEQQEEFQGPREEAPHDERDDSSEDGRAIPLSLEPRTTPWPSEGSGAMLSQVASILASPLDHHLALRSALDLALPRLGDWAILDLLSESAGIRRTVVARMPGEDREVARMLWRRLPVSGDSSDPIARVLDGGDAELIESVEDAMRSGFVGTSWGRATVRRLAPRSWITVPIRAGGTTIGALTFITAKSRRPLGEEHLQLARHVAASAALAAENARLRDEVQRANEAKSAFLAVMSHELRTPLTAIMGYTELLCDGLFGEVSEQQQVQLGRVRESSEHLLRIIEEVLQYARLEAGHEHAALEDVTLASLIEEVVALVKPSAERKRLTLEVEQPDRSVGFSTDPGRLRQVLVNLLANAVKFTNEGVVRLCAYDQGELLIFEIRDTGSGIEPSELARIFEPFWQAGQPLTRPHSGSGLGLSVTRELVTLLGGEIDVRSTVGQGSTFTVRVPRHPGRVSSRARPARPSDECSRSDSA